MKLCGATDCDDPVIRPESERVRPWWNILGALSLLFIAATPAPVEVNKDTGLSIQHCHPGDLATIHVMPIPENDHRVQGWFTTTNAVLSLRDLSMLPEGLNRLEIQSICRGLTSEVSIAVIDLQRPPPPPKLGRARMRSMTNLVHTPPPPMPPGMIPALPDGSTNRISYGDMQLMKAYYSKNGRRNQ